MNTAAQTNLTEMYPGVYRPNQTDMHDDDAHLPTGPLNTLLGFELETYQIPLEQLLPSKKVPDGVMSTRKYKQIVSSINEVGLIEPLSIIQPDRKKPEYLVLDGHLRVLALKELGMSVGPCLFAKDDETYSYNLDQVVRHWRSTAFSARKLAWGWMPPHPTLYVRRAWFEQVGVFDTRYRIAADYHIMLRLFTQAGLNPVYIPEVLVKMRLGGASNRSLRNVVRKSQEDLDALRRTGVGGVGALVWKNVSKLGQFFGKE